MIKKKKLLKVVPKRVVIIGSNGFVGSHVSHLFKLQKIPMLEISRNELDLSSENASDKLIKLLNNDDIILIAAANAPVKNNKMLVENIKMMETIIVAIEDLKIKRIIYLSSDAVYSDIKKPMTEKSKTEPLSLHGIMHLTREIMLKNISVILLSIVRPTLIYGHQDPHNGYGPNQFFNLALKGENILLFGKGEEKRDHVYVYDVASIINKIILSNHTGVINIASGKVTTFKKIAKQINKLYFNKFSVRENIRIGEMPHGGYRSFNIDEIKRFFPDYEMTSINDGLRDYFNKINLSLGK